MPRVPIKPRRRKIKAHDKTPEAEKVSHTVQPGPLDSSGEEDNLNDRDDEPRFKMKESSPGPRYEDDGFDEEQHHSDNYSDDSHDPIGEDVSSEGSCRTSIYQRSQKGDNESSGKSDHRVET